ncbi:GNAT family N-acetyltransferase [Pseudoroseicyclus tamaricis]|uniref:GNAT family N-acetyltransferase n=1 Tax=Pseudoroseicyclus tamaricis TaxID=2705421 RepID=A0A6B2JYN7_9RHOB|nr:GNAT family N-acetyltransferase [Pseudoroseicyclus tamaricis]NDV00482.1 GNAT family N-acetyltransferase [Pseudoroseicyclus tamaricis]
MAGGSGTQLIRRMAPGEEVLRTERMILRAPRPEDLDRLAAFYADEDVRRHFPNFTRTREQTAAEMDWSMAGGHASHPGYTLWAATWRDSGELIGRGGILVVEIDGVEEIELAWMLDKPWWGRGLGREMGEGLRDLGFAAGHERLIALVDLPNHASAATARSIGMSREREVDLHGLCHLFAIERPAV